MTTRDIRHSYQIEAPPATLVAALTEPDGIASWWTREVREQDGLIVAGWSGYGWEVVLAPHRDETGRQVTWRCVRSNMQGTDAWEGTEISFDLSPDTTGRTTRLDFAQTGYRESPCYDVCVQGWDFFIGTGLRQYAESGTGRPYPEVTDTRRES